MNREDASRKPIPEADRDRLVEELRSRAPLVSDDEEDAMSCVEEIEYHLDKLQEHGYDWHVEEEPYHIIVVTDSGGEELARIGGVET